MALISNFLEAQTDRLSYRHLTVQSRSGTTILRGFLSLLCAIGLAACASPIESREPISSKFSAAERTSLSRSIRPLDWNVHKGTCTRFDSEFARLTRNADVLFCRKCRLMVLGVVRKGPSPRSVAAAMSWRTRSATAMA